jgi:hypothetical protein
MYCIKKVSTVLELNVPMNNTKRIPTYIYNTSVSSNSKQFVALFNPSVVSVRVAERWDNLSQRIYFKSVLILSYGLDGPGSIPGRARFFSSLRRQDRLWGDVPGGKAVGA